MLSDLQIERFSRQILLPEIGGVGQERLLAASVRILGNGIIASTAATYLAGAGVGRLDVSPETAAILHPHPDCRVVVRPQAPSASADDEPDLVLHAGPSRDDGAGAVRRLHRLVARIVSGNAVVVDAGIACPGCAESCAVADATDTTKDIDDRSSDDLAEAIAGGILAAEAIPRLLDSEPRPPKRILLGVRDPGATVTQSLPSLTCSHTFGRDVGEHVSEGRDCVTDVLAHVRTGRRRGGATVMTAVGDAVPNPGQLKVELGILGIELEPSVRDRAKLRDDGTRVHPKGVELILPEDVRVSTAICEPPRHSPFVLCSDRDHFVLRGDRGDVDVRLVEPPAFYTRSTISGATMRDIGAVNGSFIAIRPDLACGYGVGGAPCRFCLSGGVPSPDAAPELSVYDVTEVVRAAFAEGVAEFVYFNLPASDADDGGLASIERHIRAVKSNFDTAVAVQMHPPASHRWIDEAYAMGVDAINFSLEIFDEESLRAHCPGRHDGIGRRRYLEALGHAATVFPSGTVWSDLVVGLESPESTRRGIDTLASMGVLPVLSLARDGISADARVAADEILPLYRHLFQAVREARINMGWIRDLNFAITPLEARFFVGEEARTWLTLQQFYRSRIGQSAARSLARLRRRLRVRRVSDSFDSSHL